MGWMAAIVREPAASRGSSTGRMKAGQMAAGIARARWVFSQGCLTLCACMLVCVCLIIKRKGKGGAFNFAFACM